MPLGDEKSREEKEAYASKIMAEMKLKNEKLKERYKEVQRDREKAEERNSSITLGRNLRKGFDKDFSFKTKPEREWDRGKPDMDSADWDSKHHEYYPPKNPRVYSDRRNRKDDNWRSRPNASSSRPTSSFFSKYHSNKNESSHESSTHRNDGNQINNRPRSHYTSNPTKNANDSHSQPYHNSKGDDYSQKISTSQMNSDLKRENAPHRAEGADELMWQSGSMIEAQIKFNRIENWVKSINMNQGFSESTDVKNAKEEYKSHGRGRDIGSHREKPKKFGISDDNTPKKSKDQSFRRNREYTGQSVECNVSARKKRIRERVSSVSDSKNFRDVKRKNATDRPRRKCESDMSDHASSMKESDERDTIVHRSSKSNNFHQQDKVDCNFQDPWGSDIPSNEKDFCPEGDEAWIDWGTDQQSKDVKQNSEPLKNKKEYETKPLQHNSKTKYTRQNEKSNWTDSKYQPNKFSRNSEDSNKRSLHRRKSGNDSNFRSAHSQVSVTSSVNIVQELDEFWDPIDKKDNQEEFNEILDPIDKKDNQKEFNEEWSSEVKKKNSKIPSPAENCNHGVRVNQSWNDTLESSGDKESSCFTQDGWGSPEVQGSREGINKVSEQVAKQDSYDMKPPRNNNETIRNKEVSNGLSEPLNKNELEDLNSSDKKGHLNTSLESNDRSEELVCNTQGELGEFSKTMAKDCDKISDDKEVSESMQSGSEFQKMDYCNESSDSNSQIVNYDGSSRGTSKSADKEYSVEDNLDELDSENLNEKISNEAVSLNKNSHDERYKNEQKEGRENLSSKSNTNREFHSNIDVEDNVDPKLESEHSAKHSNEIKSENLIPISDEKVIGNSHAEPDVGVPNSDDEGWSTVSDEEDDKNDHPLLTS